MKTDNSHFQEKLSIRIEIVNSIQKKEIKVFEAFSGAGKLWNEIKKAVHKKNNCVSMRKRKRKKHIGIDWGQLEGYAIH